MEFDCFLEFNMISAMGVKRLVTRTDEGLVVY